jgi:hypothetical protein
MSKMRLATGSGQSPGGFARTRRAPAAPVPMAAQTGALRRVPSLNSHAIGSEDIINRMRKGLFAALAAVSLQCAAPSFAQAGSAGGTVRLPVSSRDEIARVQQTLLETWSIVDSMYFDTSALVRLCHDLATLHRNS